MRSGSAIAVPFFLDQPVDLDLPFVPGSTVTLLLPAAGERERVARVGAALAGEVAARPSDLIVSGDCVTSIGALAGLQARGLEPAVVWIDAHGDFNTDDTTISGFLGGMPLAFITGRGDQAISRTAGLRPLDDRRVLLVDGRDLDPLERGLLDSSAVRRCDLAALEPGILPAGPIYLHVDLDVLDPSVLPGFRYPAAGGPDARALIAGLRAVIDTGRVAATNVVVTWDQARTDRPRARALLARLLDAVIS